ncbi:hypothetical protein, partial [Paenibacillus odorifer]
TTLDEPWNYTKFRQKPILVLESGIFFPINIKFLHDQVFSELYFKIRHAYPAGDTQIFSFYGRCFEKYIEMMVKEASTVSPLNYIFIPEFSFGKNKSPDVMLRLGNKLLAVEAKAQRVMMNSLFGLKEAIDKDIKRMVIDPLCQIHDCLMELKEIDHRILEGIDEIYLMSVTLGEFPTLLPFERNIHETLKLYFKIPIKAYYHVDIEEFEMIAELISRRRPIFRHLDNKTQLMPDLPFNNYLLRSHLKPRRLDFINNKFDMHVDQIIKTIFDEPVD